MLVRTGRETVVVSDEGEALGEVLAAGIEVDGADRLVRHIVQEQGLLIQGGVIRTPGMPIESTPLGVLLVANTARDVAHWLYDHKKVKRGRDFREMLADYLQTTFSKQVAQTEIVGMSTKPHKFANVVSFANGRKLILDPVAKEASSINARVVANLDVKARHDPSLIQRIIYDDTESWSASDLNLLQVGADVVPFSEARNVIRRLADKELAA
ncbi:hypothetical protein EOD10_04305 [Mesorhizobium sp. M7A.T.Ca.TU.009.01.3.2]|nr:hypothetical protein EOD10_04305 [Mesorhizobium sp. M7A.T.Ca.TU.009.01.3.2]